jgi:CheY-like chemotaxis protein
LKVLVVEDSIENQILVSRYLKSSGAWIEIAGNGEEGVQKVFSGAYDVVLMDIQMPIMDGFRATTLLREKGFTQPIFALTAHAFQEERDRALRSGFSGYLTKPINKIQLLQALEDVRLAMHAEEREARALSDYASRSLTGLVH